MMSRTLPERANLEFLTKQAKDLLKDAKAGDPIARERLRAWGPAGASERPKLADCQHALAREYGFPSWPKLRAHVELLSATDPRQALAAALKTRQPAPVAEVLSRFPSMKARLDEPLPAGAFGATPLIVAVEQASHELVDVLLANGANINQRSHWWAGGFHVLEDDHGLADFLIARGATLDAKSAAQLGRMDDLAALVAANPQAVHMRAGDGQTPLHVASTVAIAELLLSHGADIDARDVDHESTPAQDAGTGKDGAHGGPRVRA
jgi:ankyrin repeat protein